MRAHRVDRDAQKLGGLLEGVALACAAHHFCLAWGETVAVGELMRDELLHGVLHGDGRREVGCGVDRHCALGGRFRRAQQQETEHDDDGG